LLIIHTEHKDAILDGSMDHIIVPLDGSEPAEFILSHALALAKGLDAKLWLVRVTPGDNQSVTNWICWPTRYGVREFLC
ncbi:MAG TPA: hypothetical protein EYG27_12615, partial [Dehalococcoidia bacterium]|nr:hypothetical protein [Dehalococcoidia bacterium]